MIVDMSDDVLQHYEFCKKEVSATSDIKLASTIVFYGDFVSNVNKYMKTSLNTIYGICDKDSDCTEVFMKCSNSQGLSF